MDFEKQMRDCMAFETVLKLLDDCMGFENTISALISSVANKKLDLHNLEKSTLEYTESESAKIDKKENEFLTTVEEKKTKKEKYESEIRQYSEINDKLNELVALSQRNIEENKVADSCNQDELSAISVLQDFEQLKAEYLKVHQEAAIIQEEATQGTQIVKETIEHCANLVINLHKNANTLRVLEQQLKYAEQQFDIILNQLPWVSLPSSYFRQLRTSPDERVRRLADVLELQTNEINDLNESLNMKKRRKLVLLEQLAKELNDFATKRQDAILITGYHRDVSINLDI